MGRSLAREQYFNHYCKPAPTASEYIKALRESPYKTHRRMAVLLMPELEKMTNLSKEMESA